MVARLVGDTVLYDRLGAVLARQLRFAAPRVRVDVDALADHVPGRLTAPGLAGTGYLLTVRVRPPAVRRLLVCRQDTALDVVSAGDGLVAAAVVLPGPLSVVVLGLPPVQTEWLVL